MARLEFPELRHDYEELIDLREAAGKLVGRICYAREYTTAFMTYNGIFAGSALNTLTGVVLGANNIDLARGKSIPVATPQAWEIWAGKMIANLHEQYRGKQTGPFSNPNAMIDLHQFLPDFLVPVYFLNGEFLNDDELQKWVACKTEIKLHENFPESDPADEISDHKVIHYFIPENDVIFYFSGHYDSLPNKLNFPNIDYLSRIESIVLKAWEESEEFTDSERIGSVFGTDIIDEVHIFERSERS